jgi:hypothetical protein
MNNCIDILVKHQVVNRINKYRKAGFEWALDVSFDGKEWWTIYTWPNKPSEKSINEIIEVVKRTLDIVDKVLPKIQYNHIVL